MQKLARTTKFNCDVGILKSRFSAGPSLMMVSVHQGFLCLHEVAVQEPTKVGTLCTTDVGSKFGHWDDNWENSSDGAASDWAADSMYPQH